VFRRRLWESIITLDFANKIVKSGMPGIVEEKLVCGRPPVGMCFYGKKWVLMQHVNSHHILFSPHVPHVSKWVTAILCMFSDWVAEIFSNNYFVFGMFLEKPQNSSLWKNLETLGLAQKNGQSGLLGVVQQQWIIGIFYLYNCEMPLGKRENTMFCTWIG
jgi:hypothetical protein